MSIPETDDVQSSTSPETSEDKIKLLLISISHEEAKIAGKLQAATEKIRQASLKAKEQSGNPSIAVDTLIRHNTNIEHELTKSIKKEMDFQLELEELLAAISENAAHEKH